LAYGDLFQPIWTQDLEAEMVRNQVRQAFLNHGDTAEDAVAEAERGLAEMNRAFPDAHRGRRTYARWIETMTNDTKDRHVLAAAHLKGVTHLVTTNLSDFVGHEPVGLTVENPDSFACRLLAERPRVVVEAVTAMADRHQNPGRTRRELAGTFAGGKSVPKFGTALLAVLAATSRY